TACPRDCSPRRWRPPRPTLFPYTTLFRSGVRQVKQVDDVGVCRIAERAQKRSYGKLLLSVDIRPHDVAHVGGELDPRTAERNHRSEEHTSELQSRENLVCRLLLEKKK